MNFTKNIEQNEPSKTESNSGRVNKFVSNPKVDRTHEFKEPDNEILVTLECGHTERFWFTGLSNDEYINMTRYLKSHPC